MFQVMSYLQNRCYTMNHCVDLFRTFGYVSREAQRLCLEYIHHQPMHIFFDIDTAHDETLKTAWICRRGLKIGTLYLQSKWKGTEQEIRVLMYMLRSCDIRELKTLKIHLTETTLNFTRRDAELLEAGFPADIICPYNEGTIMSYITEQSPSLKTLELHMKKHQSDSPFLTNIPHTIEELYLHIDHVVDLPSRDNGFGASPPFYFEVDKDLQRISKAIENMPNLKRLKIESSSGTFRIKSKSLELPRGG